MVPVMRTIATIFGPVLYSRVGFQKPNPLKLKIVNYEEIFNYEHYLWSRQFFCTCFDSNACINFNISWIEFCIWFFSFSSSRILFILFIIFFKLVNGILAIWKSNQLKWSKMGLCWTLHTYTNLGFLPAPTCFATDRHNQAILSNTLYRHHFKNHNIFCEF